MNIKISKFLVMVAVFLSALTLSQSAFAAGPIMQTLPASSVAQTNMTLNGAFTNSLTNPVNVRFNWGTTSALGTYTSFQTFMTSNGSFSATISGLSAGTTYYFRAEGINSNGSTVANNTISQATLSSTVISAPEVHTVSTASGITSSSATVYGAFNSNGATTSTQFEYATNTSFTNSSLTSLVVQNTPNGMFSATITGLNPNTTYFYRARATNSAGTSIATTSLRFTTSAISNPTSCTYTFNVNPNPVTTGNTVTVSWTSSNCTAISVSGGGISSSMLSTTGIQSSPVNGTTTFTLTPTGPGNPQPQSITITTQSGNTGGYYGGYNYYGTGNQYCIISSFAPNINPIQNGGNTTLVWSTYNCSFVRITGPGINGTYIANGSLTTPSLTGTAYYTITAYDSYGGSIFSTTNVSVLGQSTTNNSICSINSFSASPAEISAGQSTTLLWTTSGCNFVNITSNTPNALNLQNYTANGSYAITPNGSGTYFMTAYGQNSSVTSQANVTIRTSTNILPTYHSNSDNYTGPTFTEIKTPATNNTVGGNALISGSTVFPGNPNDYYNSSNLSGLSLASGSGILPTSLLGWLLIILILMGIIIIVRKMSETSDKSHKGGH